MNFKEVVTKFRTKFTKSREPPSTPTINNCKRYDIITYNQIEYILIHRVKDVKCNSYGDTYHVSCNLRLDSCGKCNNYCNHYDYIFVKLSNPYISKKTVKRIHKYKKVLNKKRLHEVILIKNIKKNKKSTYVAENVKQILFNYTKTK